MTAQSKTTIKSYFETGDTPTQAQFADQVDSYQDVFTSAASYGVVVVSAGNPQVPVGTAGQVLTSNGAGVAPTFQSGGGGGAMVLITTATAAGSATIDFTSGIDGTYKKYVIDFSNVTFSTGSQGLRLRLQQGGSFVTSSNYNYATLVIDDDSVSINPSVAVNNSYLAISVNDIDTIFATCGTVEIYQPNLATYPNLTWRVVGTRDNPNQLYYANGGGQLALSVVTSGVRFYPSGGNIQTGIFKLYGVS